jgi:hypothetical protein
LLVMERNHLAQAVGPRGTGGTGGTGGTAPHSGQLRSAPRSLR